MKSKYVLGMDGGGSRTTVIVRTADKEGTFRVGQINFNGRNSWEVESTIDAICAELAERDLHPSDCLGICLGSAGVNNPFLKQEIERQFRRAGFAVEIDICPDFEIALWAALDDVPDATGRLTGAGLILIAGTGSVGYGIARDGRTKLTGAMGPLLDDRGGGIAIGRAILRAVVCAADGRYPPTTLTQLVCEQWKLTSLDDLVEHVYAPDFVLKSIGELAPLLDRAVTAGDEVAQQIAAEQAGYLFELIGPIVDELDLGNEKLGLLGSIARRSTAIRPYLLDMIRTAYPQLTIIEPTQTAVAAATRYARKRYMAE